MLHDIYFECPNKTSERRLIRSQKKFSTTYPIVSFFFSRPFHDNFKFLKNCPYDFHKILHSHSTPRGAPACAKASKSYHWNVRNIAKISQKNGQKTVIFHFFFDFFKNCPYDSNEIFYSPSTLYYGPLCEISSNSYCWDVRSIAKINPKLAKKTVIFRLYSIFSKTVHTIRTKFSTVIFYTIVGSMCAISINSYNWDSSESEGKRPKPTPYRICGSGCMKWSCLHSNVGRTSITKPDQCGN